MSDEQIASLKMLDGELTEFRFCAPEEASQVLRPHVWVQYLHWTELP